MIKILTLLMGVLLESAAFDADITTSYNISILTVHNISDISLGPPILLRGTTTINPNSNWVVSL